MDSSENLEDNSDSGDTSDSEDTSDSGDTSGSEDVADPEGHPAQFEVAEGSTLSLVPEDLDFELDNLDHSAEDMVDTTEMEDPALFEALQGSTQTIKLNATLPPAIVQLQEKLLGDYTLPPPPVDTPLPYALSRAEELSLQHYLAWTESQGTVKAYSAHAKVLAKATNVEILSLYCYVPVSRDLGKRD
jgi:hypothetical protein